MIKAVMIVEMLGSPKDFVTDSLKKHVSALGGYREVELLSTKISEPKLIEKEKGLYTSFAEVEFEVARVSQLAEVVFDFMPSSIEVIEPASVSFDAFSLTEFLNGISGRLHKYDDIAKAAHLRLKQMGRLLVEAEKAGFLEYKKKEIKKKKKAKKKRAKK